MGRDIASEMDGRDILAPVDFLRFRILLLSVGVWIWLWSLGNLSLNCIGCVKSLEDGVNDTNGTFDGLFAFSVHKTDICTMAPDVQ